MYARVITFQYQPGKIDEGLDNLRELFVPELRQRTGYVTNSWVIGKEAEVVQR